MKIHYNRYTEMGCFSVRGPIGISEWKMLKLGFDLLFKDLEEMLVINLNLAELSSDAIPLIIEYKKLIPKLTEQKVFIISKEKGLGDFPKFEILLSRFQGSKIRQIGEKLILEDQVQQLEHEIAQIQTQIENLGFDETSSKKEIQKNHMQKVQQKALESCLKWQKHRTTAHKAIPSDQDDINSKVISSLEELTQTLLKGVEL